MQINAYWRQLGMQSSMLSKNKTVNSPLKLFNFYKDSSLGRMINFINEAVIVVNANGTIEMVNANASALIGQTREVLLSENLLSFFSDDTGKVQSHVIQCLDSSESGTIESPPFEVVIKQQNKPYHNVSVEISISSLPEELSANNSLFICILRDLTLHKAEYATLKKKAETDFLTGLANRHKFSEYLTRQWILCNSNNLPISLILIDIDHFKLFNDEYGHIAGDRCLKRIGDLLDLSMPNRDTLAARYGGEEFAIVLPNCSAQTAQLLAIRIKRHLAQLSSRHFVFSSNNRLTVSMGVATNENHRYESKESLLNAADTLLYQAKAQGRDQICYL
jgi:diguanylate cyclase (GGDEF)-like protein/PAS domain S-box-containing protein|tara:strand:- start:1627 stop:2628 length:1002 start_codon:yes stop_codon:yes gene_type:complete